MALSFGVVKSPIAKASDFLHQLVNNFNFDAFVVPDRIKEHAKSQPIKADTCEELSLNLSEVSSLQGDVRASHEKRKKQAIQQQRPFKMAMSSPRHDFMFELRERLAERAAKSDPTTLRITGRRDEVKAIGPVGPRQKLKSHVAHDNDTGVETIPVFVSTDSLRTHKASAYSNHTSCNDFMGCLEGKTGIKNPPGRLNRQHSELMVVKDAKKTLADCKGQHGDRAFTSQGFQAEVNSLGAEVINLADSGQFELSPIDPVAAIVGEKSDETEDDNESDVESMVPLKHGKREKVVSLMETREASITHRESTMESKEESSGLMMVSSDVAVEDEAITSSPSKTAAGEESRLIPRSFPPLTMRQFDEAHQKELRFRIKQFQERRLGGSATPISLVGSSLAGSSQRPPVNLPTASRKIAQGYVDALTKKFVEESGGYPNYNSVVTLKPQEPSQEAIKPMPDWKMPTNSIVDSPILAIASSSSGAVTRPRLEPMGATSVCQDEKGRSDMENMSADVLVANTKNQGTLVDIDGIVSQIDRLVASGRLHSKTDQCQSSDEERRTLSQISAELLQNLAVLRTQQSFGGGGRFSTSSPRRMSFGTASDPPEVSKSYFHKSATDEHDPLVSSCDVSGAKSASQSGRSIQELRAKRDRAVITIRDTARRLSGWSKDPAKESSQSATMGPRNQSRDLDSKSEPSEPLARISSELLSHEQRDEVKETVTIPSLSDECLYRVPVPSQLKFNAGRIVGGRDSISSDPSGDYTAVSAFDVSTLGTDNFIHLNADVSTLASVRDEIPEVAQLESMIRGLQANRSRTQFTQ